MIGFSSKLISIKTVQEEKYDVLVYGWTYGGLTAALQAKLMGANVSLVSGWRERHFGGMMSGSLGASDVDELSAFGGLARHVISLITKMAERPDNNATFQPRMAELMFADLVRNFELKTFRTSGVSNVRKTDTKSKAFRL